MIVVQELVIGVIVLKYIRDIKYKFLILITIIIY